MKIVALNQTLKCQKELELKGGNEYEENNEASSIAYSLLEPDSGHFAIECRGHGQREDLESDR